MDYRCCTILLTSALATLLYLNTLGADFAYDDSRAIQKNPDLLPSTPLWNLVYDDFWGTPLTHSGSHKSYRPLCVLTFRLNYYLGGLEPWGYHLGNVLWHALTTAVFTWFCWSLTGSTFASLVSGALFASHPIHTEAVAGVVGRADVMACFFFLATLTSYMKYVEARASLTPGSRWGWAVSVCVLTAAAMLSKEQALTVLAVCAVYDVFVAHRATRGDVLTLRVLTQTKFRPALEGIALIAACGGTLLGFRIHFMGNRPPEFAPSDNPASDSDSLLTRVLTYNYLPSANFWMLLCPRILSFDWSMEAVPLLESLDDFRNLSTLVFYACLVFVFVRVSQTIDSWPGEAEESSEWKHSSRRKQNNNSLSYGGKFVNTNGSSGSSNGVHQTHSNGSHKSSKYSSVHSSSNGGSHSTKSLYNNVTNSGSVSSDLNERTMSHFSATGPSYRTVDVVIICISIIVFPFIPASNLFFYVGFVIAERILYIPSMGVCLLVGVGAQAVLHKLESEGKRKVLYASLALLVVSFSAKTVLRNMDWQNEERLYSSGVAVNPAKAWGNLANIYNDKKMAEKAELAYRNALKYRPNMADVHYNLGILLANQKRIDEAVTSYQNAIKFRPKLSVAHLNLGILVAQQGNFELAKSIYKRCADLDTSGLKDPRLHDGTKISCLFNHGRILMDEGKSQEALEVYNTALARRPDHYAPQSLYNMIGEVYFKMGQMEEAEKWYRDALKAKPDHIPAHLTMSKLMQAKNDGQEALAWLDKAKAVNPTDLTVDHHQAQLYTAMNRLKYAGEIYDRLLVEKADDFEIVYNAANLFRQLDKKQKAEELYIKAVKLNSKEASAWMNLGAMLHINSKYSKAEQAYNNALKLKPNDQVTLDNLKRLKKAMGAT
ncbi:protein O-mannosyl-transferase TMTC2 [Aplysia californica]|uniref:dolichyl-phosphate-mannose--protein mannosyltransferase n=1 Tax=Aplysia californica TaxID=6500 RepID=A0ABM1A9J8_APLCA|nr:protein O-mannosyl-transferase TMTC2 [Aplysia californica]